MGPILSALLGPITGAVNTVVDRLIPDVNKANEVKLAMMQELQTGALAQAAMQIEVNKAEAASPSLFVSGWRPAVGWCCVAALGYQYVLSPVAMWGATWGGFDVPMPPRLDDVMWELLFGMLGMGGLRTFEKLQGVASK